ncbi:aminotransferase-like domain-containing protein [[Eubacterium] cellulosolvens]
MDDPVAKRSSAMRASEIREILKLTQRPDVISFAGGLPNPEAFPHNEIREIADNLLKDKYEEVLQYGTTEGYTKLRQAIVKRMKRHNVELDIDNVVVVAGAQQGLTALALVVLNPGDKVAVSYPTFVGALSVFNMVEAELVPITLDEQGMNIDVLEEKLKQCQVDGNPIKLVYTVPTFQNPTGVTMPVSRRKRLIELAREFDFYIIEDNPYGELRYSGEPVDMIIALDPPKEDVGYTIYLGTFSKTVSPGFRVGWIIGQKNLMHKIVVAKQSLDLCTNVFSQAIIAEFLDRNLMDDHKENIIKMYHRKRDLMLDSMKKHLPAEVRWTNPEGGLFLWVILPDYMDSKELLKKAVEKKVAFVPGNSFSTDGNIRNTMRLNFSNASDENIVEGIRRLGEVIEDEIKVYNMSR